MNLKYDFTKTGGFPFDQGILNTLQNGILLSEAALANALGQLVIISGCVVTGGSAANGVVAIKGEILPFVGGAIATKVIIVETDAYITYFDGTSKASQITRVATFGDDGIQNNSWANFVSVTSTGILADLLALKPLAGDVKMINVTEAYISSNFDASGLGVNLRTGWAICNGNNGTVNMKGRVPVQRDPSQTEFNAMGTYGGEKTHLLTTSEAPTPAGLLPGVDGPHPKQTDGSGVNEYYGTGPLSTAAPASAAHNNLQPYITTLFIQKL